MLMAKTPHVYISGCGIYSPLGLGVSHFSKQLLEGISWIQSLSDEDMTKTAPVTVAGLVQPFQFAEVLTRIAIPEQYQRLAAKLAYREPYPIQTSILACLEAWQAAGFFEHQPNREKIGVLVAGHNLTSTYQHQFFDSFQKNPEYIPAKYALRFMDSCILGILSTLFNISGESFTLGAAMASSNIALIQGARLIEQGVLDACVVVGVQAELSPLERQAFYNAGALMVGEIGNDPKKASRPFDKKRAGFIYSQASGCIILESSNSCNTRKHAAHVMIQGKAMRLGASPTSEASVTEEVAVMKQALSDAHCHIADLHYINAHATSTNQGDEVELNAIEELLGPHSMEVWLNATKSITGHCLWSAGIIETMATILQMQEGFVHPILNLTDPIKTNFRFANARESTPSLIKYALKNSFGFFGIYSSLVLRNLLV